MTETPSPIEVFPIYYISKAIVLVLGLGIIVYACLRKPK
jgi:hypothetical protein